ncbi:MAG TPA: glycosyltransferase [Puia sp.]|jgi:1,2-diacylglycerol 3-alpha-glucosyltransferase|nr:glycosyltransferase [Puia sp.]
MRILFVCDTYYPQLNGVYYFVCRVGPMLQERGHQVAVIAPSETLYLTFKKMDRIDVYGLPSLPILNYPNVRFPIPLLLKRRVKRILNSFKPEIIHLQDHFSIAKAVVKVNKKLGVPIIGTNHFMTENLTSFVHSEKWKRRLSTYFWSQFSKVFNQLQLVTTPSETAARLIRPKLHVGVVPISSGIDLEEFNPIGNTSAIREKYSLPGKPILLFVGRLDPEKNIEEIIHAVALAVKKVDFYFVIVGRGIKKNALERLAMELGISERVVFTGYVPDADLPYIYKLSRCFIISSIAELLSLSVLQGMASGLPVIAADIGALGELVHDKVNGYLYKAGDIKMLAQCITEIISHDEIYTNMSRKSLEIAYKHDIHKTVDAFEKIYQLSRV